MVAKKHMQPLRIDQVIFDGVNRKKQVKEWLRRV